MAQASQTLASVRRVDLDMEYVVELSPRMWTRVGSISRSSFERLRERARAIAELARATRFLDGEDVPPGEPARNAFDLDGNWAVYEIDPHRRSLVVVDISRDRIFRRLD